MINETFRRELLDGTVVFVKTNPAGGFEEEAAGLRWLAEPGCIRVAEPLEIKEDPPALVLRWIERGTLTAAGEEELGQGLACVHRAGSDVFGGPSPLRLGALQIPNEPLDDWPAFYAERRLRPLLHAVDAATARDVEAVCERIDELCGPAEPPARLHGDLWSGNVMADTEGRPHLIDPLAYGGHREVDLAMLRLFGGPSRRCFDSYHEAYPLADDHEDRVALYQLFPLLIHAALFGGSYVTQVRAAARNYL